MAKLSYVPLSKSVRDLEGVLLPDDIADDEAGDAVRDLRRLIVAAEHYRQSVSDAIGLGATESQAVSVLALHGERGQSALARYFENDGFVDDVRRILGAAGLGHEVYQPADRRVPVMI